MVKVDNTYALQQEVNYLEIQEGAMLILALVKVRFTVKEIASKNLRPLLEIIVIVIQKSQYSRLRDHHSVEGRLPDPQILEEEAA